MKTKTLLGLSAATVWTMMAMVAVAAYSSNASAMTAGDARDLNRFQTEIVGAYTLGVYESIQWAGTCNAAPSYDKVLGWVVNDLRSVSVPESNQVFAGWIKHLISMKCGHDNQ